MWPGYWQAAAATVRCTVRLSLALAQEWIVRVRGGLACGREIRHAGRFPSPSAMASEGCGPSLHHPEAYGAVVPVGVVVAVGKSSVVAVGLGSGVAVSVGTVTGAWVGALVGALVGVALGALVGVAPGALVGVALGAVVGVALGVIVGVALGAIVGVALGAGVGVGGNTRMLVASTLPSGLRYPRTSARRPTWASTPEIDAPLTITVVFPTRQRSPDLLSMVSSNSTHWPHSTETLSMTTVPSARRKAWTWATQPTRAGSPPMAPAGTE